MSPGTAAAGAPDGVGGKEVSSSIVGGEPESRFPRSFFARDVVEVARDLIGCTVFQVSRSNPPGGTGDGGGPGHDGHPGDDGGVDDGVDEGLVGDGGVGGVGGTGGTVAVAVRLTEVEAYAGEADAASHAFRGRTPRTRVMFGPPGHLYLYFVYGMHWCANVVTGPDGQASAVLLRAGEVTAGIDLARARRPTCRRDEHLARGPAGLAAVLGWSAGENGADLCASDGRWWIGPGEGVAPERIGVGPRVGVSRAADTPWRFVDLSSASVSAFRTGTRRRS